MENFTWNLTITFIIFYGAGIVQGSIKKGAAISSRVYRCDDFKSLNNTAWWYNWAPNLDKMLNNTGCSNVDMYVNKHVPMVWGYGKRFSTLYLNDQAEYLLGFNEPNHKGQSNILAEDAASYWKEIETLAGDRPIVSPAAAPCSGSCNDDMKTWFDNFFKSCNDCRVDYLATHMYSCSANKTMAFLEDLYKTYNLPIWLTEFACPYKTNPERQLRYMKEVLPLLEAAKYVFRYAWFVSRITNDTATNFIPKAASLLEPDSSKLTVLGEFYNSFTGSESSTSSTARTAHSTTTKRTSNQTSASATVYNITTVTKSYNMSTSSSYYNTTTTTHRNIFNYTDGTVISCANRSRFFVMDISFWILVPLVIYKS